MLLKSCHHGMLDIGLLAVVALALVGLMLKHFHGKSNSPE